MPILAREQGNGNGFSPVEQGLHQAVCYAVYDLGTHFSQQFGKSSRKVLIMWELPEERIELERDGKTVNLPRSISKQYTLSLNEKSNLRRDLQTWRSKEFTQQELAGFDITRLLGVNCAIQVLHTEKNGRIYANVAAVTPLPKGLQPVKPENAIRYFSFEDGRDIPGDTPPWVEDIIKQADEWAVGSPAASPSNGAEDDLPF